MFLFIASFILVIAICCFIIMIIMDSGTPKAALAITVGILFTIDVLIIIIDVITISTN